MNILSHHINRLCATLLVLSLSQPLWGNERFHKTKRGNPSELPITDAEPLSASPLPDSPQSVAKRGKPTQIKALSSTACAAKHSVETFVQITSASQPQSDGIGGVYFLSDLRESPQVFHLSQPGQWPSQISFFPEGVVGFRVSPQNDQILFSTQEGGNEQYQLHLLKLKTKEVEPLIANPKERVESFFWSPNSDWVAFTSNRRNGLDFDLYQLDLKTHKETLLSELQGLNSVTDISSNGNLIALTQYRSVIDSDVLVFNIEKKKLSNVTTAFGKSASKHGLFTANSKSLLFISDRGTEKSQLQLLTLEDKSSPTLLSRELGEVEDVELDKSRRSLIYTTNVDGYAVFSGTDILTNGLFQKPFAVPRDRSLVLSSPSFLKSGPEKQFFFSETASSEPTGVWFWNGGTKKPWTQTAKSLIEPQCFAKESLIRYPSFDGTKIPAFLFLPRDYGTTKRPIPFVIYSHGGPEAQYRPSFSKIFQYFLQRGFGILAPNIRGSTGYGKIYVGMDDYKKRMDSVKDTLEGAKWLISNGYTLPQQLGIFGGSYGGFMVLRSVQEGSELFAAASESVGITDFVTFLKNTKPYRRPLREVEYGPLSDEEFLKSISPMSYLGKIKTPLLVFHGANDPRVPVSETEQLAKVLNEKNIPVELKIFADEGHGNTKLRNILEQARLMVHFFEKQFGEQIKKGP